LDVNMTHVRAHTFTTTASGTRFNSCM